MCAGDASAVADGQRGVRCAQFHPRGHQLATGDRAGNIRYGNQTGSVYMYVCDVVCVCVCVCVCQGV